MLDSTQIVILKDQPTGPRNSPIVQRSTLPLFVCHRRACDTPTNPPTSLAAGGPFGQSSLVKPTRAQINQRRPPTAQVANSSMHPECLSSNFFHGNCPFESSPAWRLPPIVDSLETLLGCDMALLLHDTGIHLSAIQSNRDHLSISTVCPQISSMSTVQCLLQISSSQPRSAQHERPQPRLAPIIVGPWWIPAARLSRKIQRQNRGEPFNGLSFLLVPMSCCVYCGAQKGK